MDDTLDIQFLQEKEMADEIDYHKVAADIREIGELEKMKRFLEAENDRLRRQVDILTGELDGISIALSSTKSYTASYLERRRKSLENIDKQKSRKELLLNEIDQLHLKVKASQEDERSLANLSNSLEEELDGIRDERLLVRKKFSDMKSGINQIAKHKESKLPDLKSYDDVLRQIYRVFKETQHRMDVSLIMKKR
ncbi:MAG: hypothetical protein HQK57_06935 [Deltaproteobacteria bacterium]|nr:hypothetical protein [Deltaproteobacteria bacterium]